LGRVGLIIGEDVRYPEVARILTLQGASILIHVAALPAPFDEEAWLASLWRLFAIDSPNSVCPPCWGGSRGPGWCPARWPGRCFNTLLCRRATV
jgi:predicted amidohydrolase